MKVENYVLRCTACDFSTETDGYRLHCPRCGRDALLRTEYSLPIETRAEDSNFFAFSNWLPFGNPLGVGGPQFACLQNEALCKVFGLRHLWVLLSGHAPSLGASSRTGSFKEAEALGVLSRVREQTEKMLIISSAGNAGRAFLDLGWRAQWPIVVVVPQSGENLVRVPPSDGRPIPLLVILEDAMYPQAIRFVDRAMDAFNAVLVREGGCFNVARRDAMGVPFLRAIRAMGRLPDRYVQAVGSGTGAIAAWEARNRLIEHGCVESKDMRLHLVQNAPFTLMFDAWTAGVRAVERLSDDEVHHRLSQTFASVLSNATPPYSVRGGVFDVLKAANGTMSSVCNEDAMLAQSRVEDCLGVRPCAAASVAAAGLLAAVQNGSVDRDEHVLLHLTGTAPEVQAELVSYPNVRRIRSTEEGLRVVGDYLSMHSGLPLASLSS